MLIKASEPARDLVVSKSINACKNVLLNRLKQQPGMANLPACSHLYRPRCLFLLQGLWWRIHKCRYLIFI
jgi:hypothetical protein